MVRVEPDGTSLDERVLQVLEDIVERPVMEPTPFKPRERVSAVTNRREVGEIEQLASFNLVMT